MDYAREWSWASRSSPIAPSVRSQSAVASFVLIRRQRNQPPDVALQTFTHTYADLFDDELDNIAAALDSLDDLSQGT